MKRPTPLFLAGCMTAWLASFASVGPLMADEANDAIIKQVMKTYHKAPKGEDPICKKAVDGKATADEIKKLVAAYQKLSKTTPPKGDAAAWKAKTSKLLAAAQALEKGDSDATVKYKEAVGCKACHDAHKPE